MDAEAIKEAFKNINIKGELNSETVEKVSKEIMPKIIPYLWFSRVMGLVESCVWAAVVFGVAMAIGKFFYFMSK